MLVQSSTFVFYLLTFIILMFIIVNGQEECVDICPPAGAGWVSELRATPNGTQVMLRWDPYSESGGTAYIIQYRLENVDTNPEFNASFATAATVEDVVTYTITAGRLLPVTEYEVRVCLAESPGNCGDCLLCVETDYDPVPPTEPTLMGSVFNALAVRLTWTHPIGSVESYNITFSSMSEPLRQQIISNPALSSTLVEDLLSNTTYQFQIQAVNQYGTSPLSNTVSLTTLPPSDSPGFLLKSDSAGISYYYTRSSILEANLEQAVTATKSIRAAGITGMSFYPTNSTSGYVYTSSSGTITRHDTTLDKMAGSISLTPGNEVMNRLPAAVLLITVDWVNDMLYWLEVNDTHAAIMHSFLNGSDVDCVTSVNPVGVTAIEVDPIHGYLYWSVMGAGGGIFQLDLTLAITASCSNSAVGAVNIIPDYATNGINSMTLNLEDSLIYFAPGSTNLASISLGEKLIVNYTHTSGILNASSMASYNEYLAVPVVQGSSDILFGLFVQIRPSEGPPIIGIFGETESETSHMYMIREEFQPLPVPPGPVGNVKYLPTTTSISYTWSRPLYLDDEFGMGAFNRWTYNVSLNPLGVSNVTMDTTYENTNLIPNTAYIIDIFPFFPETLGPVDNVNDELTSSWIVQTVDNVTPTPNVILATSVGSGGPIYTFLMGYTQAVQLNVDEPLVQRSIGVAYDFHHNTLYWTTENDRVVQLSLDGESNELTNVELSSSLGSIGVDYIGQRLYWIEDPSEIKYMLLDSTSINPLQVDTGEGITDLVVDSPNGLLFWSHNGATRGISVLRLNGVGGRMMCVADNNQLYQYHAITVDTENKRIFWIKEVERIEMAGSFQIGVADYNDGSCTNHVNKMISSELSGESSSDRISMTYVAGLLLYTSSAIQSTIFVAPSSFSSFSSSDYQLAVGSYSISTDAGVVNIRSITANQTSQQFLPDNVELNVATVRPSVPVNIHLDDGSTPTFINITWDMVEGVPPAIITYEVTYSLSRLDGSTKTSTLQTNNNYFVLEDQSPETTVNVSVTAYTRWYSSEASPVEMILSDSRIPDQIERSSASVFTRERGSSDLVVLLTWAGLTIEQAGGVLTSYMVSLYTTSQPTRTLLKNVRVDPSEVLLEPTGLMTDQMYSFTVRAVNRAGDGPESEEVTFSTNGPQPPIELLAIDSEGVTTIVGMDQSLSLESLGEPFAVDNHPSVIYYVDSNNLMSVNLNILNSPEELVSSLSMVSSLALDWVGRRLYITRIPDTTLIIQVLALDNPTAGLEEVVIQTVPSGVTVKTTLSPYTGQLYWTEANSSSVILYQLNLLDQSITPLYPSNSRNKRNVMCLGSSGLGTFGELTPALTYDAITDRLWVSTEAGEIWSCDLSGCNCSMEVEGTALLSQGNVLSNISLPTDSISLDSVDIYWSGPAGVFSVPRNDVTMLSPLSSLNVSSIVTIDPGQQPLPVERCLYPAITSFTQPMPSCLSAATTSDSLSIDWNKPQVTADCQNHLYAFPTISYHLNYYIDDYPNEGGVIDDLFINQSTVNELLSLSDYNITVFAFNVYTPPGGSGPNSIVCTTAEGRPSGVRDLQASPINTTVIRVTWLRPVASGTPENLLSYNISVEGGTYDDTLDDSTTMYVITDLAPGAYYTIQVVANNSIGPGDQEQTVSFTYGLPPIPMVNDASVGNVSASVNLTLLVFHVGLNISLVLEPTGSDTLRINLSNDTEYPLTLTALFPATNYTVRSTVVYPNGELLYSDPDIFTTNDGVPGIPDIRLFGTVLHWSKPLENGQPISEFLLKRVSRPINDTFSIRNLNLSSMEFSYDLSVRIQQGVPTTVSLSARNDVGSSDFSRELSITIPTEGENGRPETGVLIGIIVGASVLAIIVLIIVIVSCYCYRLRPKNYDYAYRVEVPYDMELRKLRLNQMRMANNDLYSPNYNPDDVETLKKFPRDRIKLEKLLGRGAFGEVWAGTALDIMGPGTGPHPVALKTLQKNATESDQRSFLSEAIVMSNFDHLNVLPVLGVCLNNNPFFLILELMEAGDLLAFLRGARQENGPPLLTIEELVKIALDVANGAKYLESQHFVHRDLAARNCLVSSKGPDRVVKIGDFGLARDVYHSDYYRKEGQGLLPVRWMAPESLLDGKFTVDSDIWSYGILLWEITTMGRQPYPARSNQEVFQFVIGGGRCEKPDNCQPKLYRLMRQCWAHRPEERPRFTVIVETLSRLHERLVDGNETSSSEESEFEEEEPRYTIQPRGSGGRRSLRSSIRSGASNIVTGIVNLTRAGSMRMRNSIRRQGSIRRQEEINEARAATSINRGRSVSSSEQQLLAEPPSSGLDHLVDDSAGAAQSMNDNTKEQNGFREIGPF